jgi:quercetin dioxygenase-like cupin family protein
VKVIRANIQTGGGTGPHTHTMAQCFYVLGGSATLRVEGHGDTPVTPGDAMCFGDGVDHDVTEYSSDYVVLVWCTPAEFDTTPTR